MVRTATSDRNPYPTIITAAVLSISVLATPYPVLTDEAKPVGYRNGYHRTPVDFPQHSPRFDKKLLPKKMFDHSLLRGKPI